MMSVVGPNSNQQGRHDVEVLALNVAENVIKTT